MPAPAVVYEVSAEGMITAVGGAWDAFASENAAADLTGPAVVGTSLWGWVASPEVRLLLSRIIELARTSGRSVTIPYRCDSPQLRRYMYFVAESTAAGDVRVTHHLLRAEPRAQAATLLDPLTPRGIGALRMCSWCNRVDIGEDQWLELDDALKALPVLSLEEQPQITHGMCEVCESVLARECDLLDAS